MHLQSQGILIRIKTSYFGSTKGQLVILSIFVLVGIPYQDDVYGTHLHLYALVVLHN